MIDRDMEVWKEQVASDREGYKAGILIRLETRKAATDAEKLALSTCILVNGGSAVALLALLGSLTSARIPAVAPSALAPALATFALGVLLGMAATGAAFLAHEASHRYVSSEKGSQEEKKSGESNTLWLRVARSLVLGSYAAFVFGAIYAYAGFR